MVEDEPHNQFFYNNKELTAYQKGTICKRKSLPGYHYFKKIDNIIDNHIERENSSLNTSWEAVLRMEIVIYVIYVRCVILIPTKRVLGPILITHLQSTSTFHWKPHQQKVGIQMIFCLDLI